MKATLGLLFHEMVIPKGVEPLIFWMRTRRPGPLDDGTNHLYILTENALAVNPRSKLQHIFEFFKHYQYQGCILRVW